MRKKTNRNSEAHGALSETLSAIPDSVSINTLHETAGRPIEQAANDHTPSVKPIGLHANPDRRFILVPVAETVYGQIQKQAKSQGVSAETLVNLLLQKQIG